MAAGIFDWGGSDAPQVSAVRLLSRLDVLQAACALQGANVVWSTPKGSCVTAKAAPKCPSAKPLLSTSKCYSKRFCSGSSERDKCRSSCRWGANAVGGMEPASAPITIAMKIQGVTKPRMEALKKHLEASIAGSLQIEADRVSVLHTGLRDVFLEIVLTVALPTVLAKA